MGCMGAAIGLTVAVAIINTFTPAYAAEPTPPAPGGYISIDEAIEILDRARESHIWYAEHPEYCNEWTGDVDWNRDWVEQYTWVIDLLYALREAGAETLLG